MRSIKVIIVEDEIVIARDIANHLERLGCEICGILMEGESLIPLLEKSIPDIILMDIMLKGELDGIRTVRQMQQRYSIPVIYMTANTDDYSFELAKATKPFAFIEKPFKVRNLLRSFELLIEQLMESDSQEQELPSFMLKDRIFVREKDQMIKISLKDILYIEAERAYCKIITSEKSFLLSISLGNLEKKIRGESLMRIHRSFVINLTKIDGLQDNYVQINQKFIPVSRSYWESFLDRINII